MWTRSQHELLFERFLAPERDGPPDIDVDIESDRREEVIQYVYDEVRPGAHRAGRQRHLVPAAVGGAGHGQGVRLLARASRTPGASRSTAGAAWPPSTSTDIPEQVVAFANELQTFPRHLGIHSGGMVICDRPVIEVCPVEWGRMPGRTVLQWDKDDCAAVGLVKFDLLGLGMLSALHYAYDMIESDLDLGDMPLDDPEVYDDAVPGRLGRASSRWRAGRRWPPCPGSSRDASTTWWSRWR